MSRSDQLDEAQIVRSFIRQADSTHNIVTDISVRLLLNYLRDQVGYIIQDEAKSNFIREFETQLMTNHQASLPDYVCVEDYEKIRTLIAEIKEIGKTKFTVLGYYDEEGQKQTDNSYTFREQFNLVCAVVMHYPGTVKDKEDRVLTLWNGLKLQLRESVCETGQRNEWVFSIGSCFPDIKLIENFSAFLVEHMKAYFDSVIKEFSPAEQFRVLKSWIVYAVSVDADTSMYDFLTSHKGALTEYMLSVCKPYQFGSLERREIAGYIDSLESLSPPDSNEFVPMLREILTPVRQESVWLVKARAVLAHCSSFDDVRASGLAYFWQMCSFRKAIDRYTNLAISMEGFSEATAALMQILDDYLRASLELDIRLPFLPLPTHFIAQRQRFLELEKIYKKEIHFDWISNFFATFLILDGDERHALCQTLLLLNQEGKIALTDDDIDQFIHDHEGSGIIDIRPYEINRIFLQGFLTRPDEWSDSFTYAYEQVLKLIVDKAREGIVAQNENRLLEDSYPVEFRADLSRLLKMRQLLKGVSSNVEKCQQLFNVLISFALNYQELHQVSYLSILNPLSPLANLKDEFFAQENLAELLLTPIEEGFYAGQAILWCLSVTSEGRKFLLQCLTTNQICAFFEKPTKEIWLQAPSVGTHQGKTPLSFLLTTESGQRLLKKLSPELVVVFLTQVPPETWSQLSFVAQTQGGTLLWRFLYVNDKEELLDKLSPEQLTAFLMSVHPASWSWGPLVGDHHGKTPFWLLLTTKLGQRLLSKLLPEQLLDFFLRLPRRAWLQVPYSDKERGKTPCWFLLATQPGWQLLEKLSQDQLADLLMKMPHEVWLRVFAIAEDQGKTLFWFLLAAQFGQKLLEKLSSEQLAAFLLKVSSDIWLQAPKVGYDRGKTVLWLLFFSKCGQRLLEKLSPEQLAAFLMRVPSQGWLRAPSAVNEDQSITPFWLLVFKEVGWALLGKLSGPQLHVFFSQVPADVWLQAPNTGEYQGKTPLHNILPNKIEYLLDDRSSLLELTRLLSTPVAPGIRAMIISSITYFLKNYNALYTAEPSSLSGGVHVWALLTLNYLDTCSHEDLIRVLGDIRQYAHWAPESQTARALALSAEFYSARSNPAAVQILNERILQYAYKPIYLNPYAMFGGAFIRRIPEYQVLPEPRLRQRNTRN